MCLCTYIWRKEGSESCLREHQMHLQTLVAEPTESLGKNRETSQAQADALSPRAIMLTAACWQGERQIPGSVEETIASAGKGEHMSQTWHSKALQANMAASTEYGSRL